MGRKTGTCGIYAITTPNGSMYIGSSICIERRWVEHRGLMRRGTHFCRALHNAYKKHGDRLAFSILCECAREDLPRKEQEYIDLLKPVLNTVLSAHNVWASEEVAAKLRKIHTSKEWREERSRIALRPNRRSRSVECSDGSVYPTVTIAARAYGIKASGIIRLAMTHQRGRLGVKFRYVGDAWKEEKTMAYLIRETRLKNGYRHSVETRMKMSMAHKGQIPNRQRIERMAETNCIPVTGTCLDSGQVVRYKSTLEAAIRHHGKSVKTAQAQISKAISGVKKSAYGYQWSKDSS